MPVTLQGLLGSTYGTPNIGDQTITYTINGDSPITSPPFTVPDGGVGQSYIINIPNVPGVAPFLRVVQRWGTYWLPVH